jgi:hypothetical protein
MSEDKSEDSSESARETTDKVTYTKSYGNTQNGKYDKARGNDKAERITEKTAEDLSETKENIRQKATKSADERKSSEVVEKTAAGARTLLGKPIVIILIVAVIVIIIISVSLQMYFSNESDNIENFNALWNQSLADLRSGNMTVAEYCNYRVHDQEFCNKLNNLEYME